MLSLNSFSQTDTTKVTLPTKVVRLAAKDLVRYDGCKEELKLTQEKVIKLEARETQKDTIISLLESKDKNNLFLFLSFLLSFCFLLLSFCFLLLSFAFFCFLLLKSH